MAKVFRKSTWKKIVAITLAAITTIAAVAGISALVKHMKDDKKTIHPTFSVGGITETGAYNKDKKDSICTKESFEAKGLEINLDFDASVEYQVFIYDEKDNLLSSTEVFNKSESVGVPSGCYARVMVTPEFDANELEPEIKWYEVSKYANQLEIRVDKNQGLSFSDFTAYSLDPAKIDREVFEVHANQTISPGEEFREADGHYTYVLDMITAYDQMYLFVKPVVGTTLIEGEESRISVWVKTKDTTDTDPVYYYGSDVGWSYERPIKLQQGDTVYIRYNNVNNVIEEATAYLYLANI